MHKNIKMFVQKQKTYIHSDTQLWKYSNWNCKKLWYESEVKDSEYYDLSNKLQYEISYSLSKFKNIRPGIKDIIKKSEYIYKLKNNWDDEGALWISKNIWDNAISIIQSIYTQLPNKLKNILVSPDILPTTDWSIHISWRDSNYSILIEVDSKLNSYYNIYIDNKNHGGNYDEDTLLLILNTKF